MLFFRGLGLTRDPYTATRTSVTTTRTAEDPRLAYEAPTVPTRYIEPTPMPTSYASEPMYVTPVRTVEEPYTPTYVEPPPPPPPEQQPIRVFTEPATNQYLYTMLQPEPQPEPQPQPQPEPLPPPPPAFNPPPPSAGTHVVVPPQSTGAEELPWSPWDSTDYPKPSYQEPAPTSQPPPSAGTQVKVPQTMTPVTSVAWYSPSAWFGAFRSLPPVHKAVFGTGLLVALLGAAAVGESRRRRRS